MFIDWRFLHVEAPYTSKISTLHVEAFLHDENNDLFF